MLIITDFGKAKVILVSLGKKLGCKKTKTLSVWQKIQKPCIGIWHISISRNQRLWVPKLINKLQSFNLLLHSVTSFSDLQNKICMIRIMKRIMTQKVLHNLQKYLLNGYFFTLLPKALFRTQSKVHGGAFLQI